MPLSAAELDALAATHVKDPLPPETLTTAITSPPFIPSRSLINIRDVGSVAGSAISSSRVYRSGTLEVAANDPDAQAWLQANVKRIFDLRSASERKGAPDPAIEGVENVWFDINEEKYIQPVLADFAVGDGSEAWRRQLLNAAKSYQPSIRAVLEHVRDRPSEPFLYHCTAGRDRTGVMSGLLQYLAGTAPNDVIRDYMLSRIGIEPAREVLTAFAMSTVGADDPSTPGFYNLVSLKPEYWNAFLQGVDDEFGGWDGYVTKGLGFSEEDLQKIKANLRD